MMTTPDTTIRGGLDLHTESKLERLAVLFSRRAGGVHSSEAEAVAREVSTTSPDFAPACWKLLDLWEDYGTEDAMEAVDAYQAVGWQEAALLALPDAERRAAVASSPELQTRELALRILVTDERLWHERPGATLEVAALAVVVAEAALYRRQRRHLRLVGGSNEQPRTGLPEIEVAIRAYGRYLNALRVRGDFANVRKHVEPLDELTRDPVGKSLAEVRWLLGTALIDLEEWERADAVLLDAIRAYRRAGKRFEAKRARVVRVMLLRTSGAAPKRYLSVARRVFKSFTEVDRLRQPTLFIGWRMNVPLYMVEAGEPLQAEALWRKIPPFEQVSLEQRRLGTGAIIDYALGRTDDAEREFRAVAARFQDLSMPYDAALFLLYLADLLLAVGRLSEGEETLLQALGLFERCQLRRHVVQALDRLREALLFKDQLRAALGQAIARASGIVRRHGERSD